MRRKWGAVQCADPGIDEQVKVKEFTESRGGKGGEMFKSEKKQKKKQDF